MIDVLRREFIDLWYYFEVQLRQIFGYWLFGIIIGSVISVFGKERINELFRSLQNRKLGVFGVIPASIIGIASPLCMYGTIPIAASFSQKGMKDDWLAAFMMSSILLNPQLAFASLFGSQRGFGTLMAATLGVPLYVCGGGTIPLLQQWLASGMSMGAATTFMITGPATKITNLGAVKIVLGAKRFALYILFSILFAIVSGLVVDMIV